MPINIGTIFLLGGTLGWIVVKILKPERYLEGIVIAACSAGTNQHPKLLVFLQLFLCKCIFFSSFVVLAWI